MTITLLLTKEDIVTSKIGLHYQIAVKNGVVINFSPEAATELVNDLSALLQLEKQSNEK